MPASKIASGARGLPMSTVECGAAGEDDGLRLDAPEGFVGRLEGNDLGIDAGLADAPGDQLRDLAAEIDDEDGVGMSGGSSWRAFKERNESAQWVGALSSHFESAG